MNQMIRLVGRVFALTALAAGAARAQERHVLGPVDGAGLAPLDTGRVHLRSAAPDFVLESMDGGTVRLSQFRGKNNVVLIFYRGHW